MKYTNIHEAKTNLSKLIQDVENGDEVIIGRGGKPVAKLIKYKKDAPIRVPGLLKGQILIASDFDAYFDELDELFYTSKL